MKARYVKLKPLKEIREMGYSTQFFGQYISITKKGTESPAIIIPLENWDEDKLLVSDCQTMHPRAVDLWPQIFNDFVP